MRKFLLLVFLSPFVLFSQNSTAFRKNYNYTLFDFPANIVEGLTSNTYILAGSGITNGIVAQLNDTGGIMWTYSYNMLFNDIKKDAANNQYYLCGSSSNSAVLLILDLNGNVVTSKKFSIAEANDAVFSRVIKASDGGYVAVGYVTGYDPDGVGAEIKYNPITYTDNNGDSQTDYISSPLIVKLDASGNQVWHRVFRYYTAATKDPATERIYNDAGFNDVAEVSDGYVAVGSYDVNQHRSATNSDGDDATPTDALILKTNTSGTITYHKQVDNPSTSTSQSSKYLSAVNTTSAGAIIAGGTDDSRELIQKFAGAGGFSNTFSRLFRYSQTFFVNDPSDVSQIYEVSGSTDLVTMAMYIKPLSFFSNSIHRVNSTATSNVWAKHYDFTGMFTILPRGSLASDGGYVCASMGAGGGTNYDFHVIKTDNIGDTPLSGCPPTSFSPTAQGGPGTFADPYNNSWSGTPGANSISITRSAISMTPYFVCTKIPCVAPQAATTVNASPAAICQGQSSSITASGPTPNTTYSVYTTATGGSSIGTTPLTVTPSSTTTYYVESSLNSDPACTSTSRTSVTVTVNTAAVPTITASGPTSFCQGGSVTLTSSAGNSYAWSNGNTTQSINVTTPGSYTVTVTYANGCSNNSGSTTVSVNNNPIPTISASGPTSFCQGGNVTLTSSAASSYLWSNGLNTQSINVTSAGSYSVTVTDGNGCTGSSGSTTVTVNSNPTPVISGANSVCSNSSGSYSVTSNAGSTYSWSISNGSINSGQGTNTVSVSWNTSGAASLTVTETNSNSCAGSNTMNVTINSSLNPTITASGSTTICQSDTVTLDAGAGYTSYLWNTNESTQTITVTASGTFTVSVTDANGCSGSSASSVTVTVNPNPTPTIMVNGSTVVCEGDSVMLDAGAGYSSYLWSTGETTQMINADSIGSYYVTVTDANGCTGATLTPTNIDVISTPVVTVTPSGNTTFCDGGSITLDAGNGYAGYLWNTGDTMQIIIVTASGNYSVSVTNSSGCSNDSAATSTQVTVNPNPVASISGNNPVCSGDTVFLLASGGEIYLWNTGNNDSTLNVTQPGTYYVTVSDLNNCSDIDTAIVVIYQSYSIPVTVEICTGDSVFLSGNYQTTSGTYYDSLLTTEGCDSIIVYALTVNQSVTNNAAIAICSGDSVFLEGNYQTNQGTFYDTLSTSIGCDSVIITTLTVNPAYLFQVPDTICSGDSVFLQGNYQILSGTYYDTLSSAIGGCDSVIITNLQVNPAPSAQINTASANICEGELTTLCVTPAGLNTIWNNGLTIDCISVSPVNSTTFSVTLTDANFCSDMDSILVAVTPIPVILMTGDSITCSNEPLTLSAAGGMNYLWSTSDTDSVIIARPGYDSTFYVTVSNGSCISTDSIFVQVLPAPDATTAGASPDTTIYYGEVANLYSYGNGTYVWSPSDDLSCSNCYNPQSSTDSTKVYYLVITAPNGCSYLDSVIVTVEKPPSEVFVPNIFSPNGDGENDKLFVYGRYVDRIELVIYDRWGEKIFETNDKSLGWDGTYKGELLNTAVFAYYLKAYLVDGSVYEKHGNTTLLR